MCCGFKGKEFSYRVDPHIPVPQLFKEVKTILNVKLGIKSSSDILSTREKFEKTSERLALHECNDWTLLKKKEVRGLLLENFIISRNKSFNRIKQKRLLSSLMLAIQLKIINNEDISIYHGRVTEIKKWEKIQNTNLKDWDFNTKKKVIKTKK
jgi:hypothetical protein